MLRAAAVLCVAAAATAALLYVGKWEKMGNSADVPDETDDDRPEYYYNGAWYTQNTELETLLIAGIDNTAISWRRRWSWARSWAPTSIHSSPTS